jgi:hypothetical protein
LAQRKRDCHRHPRTASALKLNVKFHYFIRFSLGGCQPFLHVRHSQMVAQ